jgi:hypothetical protein
MIYVESLDDLDCFTTLPMALNPNCFSDNNCLKNSSYCKRTGKCGLDVPGDELFAPKGILAT